jgi:hypothetical protein
LLSEILAEKREITVLFGFWRKENAKQPINRITACAGI